MYMCVCVRAALTPGPGETCTIKTHDRGYVDQTVRPKAVLWARGPQCVDQGFHGQKWSVYHRPTVMFRGPRDAYILFCFHVQVAARLVELNSPSTALRRLSRQ